MVNALEGSNPVIFLGQILLKKRSFFAEICDNLMEKIVLWEPVMKFAFLSIRWEISQITFKIMAHYSSTLSQLSTSSIFLLISTQI